MKIWLLERGYSHEGSTVLGLYESEDDAIKEAKRLVNVAMTRALRALTKKDPFVTVWRCEYLSDTKRIWREHSAWAYQASLKGELDWTDGGGEYILVECYDLHLRATDPKNLADTET